MKPLPLVEVYQLIEPGPVALLTTRRDDRPNVMTISWHTMVEFDPPLLACVLSARDYSFEALRATGECVLAIPPAELAASVVGIGNCSGREGVDKFRLFGLTPLPASCVKPPLIAECFANLECKTVDTRLVDKYGLFVLQVLKAWRDPLRRDAKTLHHHGWGVFVVDGDTITLCSRKP